MSDAATEALGLALNLVCLASGWRIAHGHRDGWALALLATIMGAALNWRLALVSGLAFNALGLIVNARGWIRHRRQEE